MARKGNLTLDSFRDLWENELLPSIRDEIKIHLKEIKKEFEDRQARCLKIEQSQDVLRSKFDQFADAIRTTSLSQDYVVLIKKACTGSAAPRNAIFPL